MGAISPYMKAKTKIMPVHGAAKSDHTKTETVVFLKCDIIYGTGSTRNSIL